MSARGWKRARQGRQLEPINAEALVEREPQLNSVHRRLQSEGYRLTPRARAYLTKQRRVTVTFVWRKRDEAMTFTCSWKVSFREDDFHAYA